MVSPSWETRVRVHVVSQCRGLPGKKLILEQAIKVEKDAGNALRMLATITVTAGAANDDLTVEKRNTMMIRLRQNLFSARQLFQTMKSKTD